MVRVPSAGCDSVIWRVLFLYHIVEERDEFEKEETKRAKIFEMRENVNVAGSCAVRGNKTGGEED